MRREGRQEVRVRKKRRRRSKRSQVTFQMNQWQQAIMKKYITLSQGGSKILGNSRHTITIKWWAVINRRNNIIMALPDTQIDKRIISINFSRTFILIWEVSSPWWETSLVDLLSLLQHLDPGTMQCLNRNLSLKIPTYQWQVEAECWCQLCQLTLISILKN